MHISVHQAVTLIVPVIDYSVSYSENVACKEEEQ